MKSKDIKLRALEPLDIDLLFKWENDTSIWLVSNTIVPFSRFILKKYIERSQLDIYQTKQLRLMIDVKMEKGVETVGTIDLFDFDPFHQRAGVGILIIKKENRQKGYASEALKILINYCFNTLNLHQLYCNIDVANATSLKLFKKHNFQIIGEKKEWTRYGDKWIGEYMLQLIKE